MKTGLRVATWNINYENTDVEAACAFVHSLFSERLYDFVCLQEVSEALLTCMKKESGVFFTTGIDAVLQIEGNHTPIYHVIISREKPISSKEHDGVIVPDIHENNPFSPLLRWKNIWLNPPLSRKFLSADFSIDGQDVRIFSVHPPLSSPHDRGSEVSLIFRELSEETANIVCGDFNILETYPVKLLNWFLRGHFWQAMPWYPERQIMEKRFAEAGLKNPHAGMHLKTQREARSQLDHILIPASALVTDHGAFEGLKSGFVGSDHYPVYAKIVLSDRA